MKKFKSALFVLFISLTIISCRNDDDSSNDVGDCQFDSTTSISQFDENTLVLGDCSPYDCVGFYIYNLNGVIDSVWVGFHGVQFTFDDFKGNGYYFGDIDLTLITPSDSSEMIKALPSGKYSTSNFSGQTFTNVEEYYDCPGKLYVGYETEIGENYSSEISNSLSDNFNEITSVQYLNTEDTEARWLVKGNFSCTLRSQEITDNTLPISGEYILIVETNRF